jgi:hypothetical protein
MTQQQRKDIVRCDRCHREINEFWCVLGYEGTYGKQCATEICQGNVKLLRKKVVSIAPEDLDFEIPF